MRQMSLPFSGDKKKHPRKLRLDLEAAPIKTPTLKLLMDLRPDWQRDPNLGPGPSRIVYRMRRAWAKTWVRQCLRLVPLIAAVGFLGWNFAGDHVLRRALEDRATAWIDSLSARPEFAVGGLMIAGASEDLERRVREVVDLAPGASSLKINVAAVKIRVESIGAVRSADVVLDPQGILRISVAERHPAALWRDAEDRLWLIDRDGAQISPAVIRAGYPELPLLLGDAAPAAAAEALNLFDAAPDIHSRLRAIVRVGARRWDFVLDRELRILLPERDPGAALAHAVALHYGEELFDRDLLAVDMRVPQRPTLRMTPRAVERLRLLDAAGPGPGEDT